MTSNISIEPQEYHFNYDTPFNDIKTYLNQNGFVVITNVLTQEEISQTKEMFFQWKNSIPNFDSIHKKVDPHGIYKHHEVGHQKHAWFIRTRPNVQEPFKKLWDTDELIVSYDGSCYIAKNEKRQDNIWTHTDQAPNSKGLCCYQGFVTLTNNKERTLRLFKGSHQLHENYFTAKGIKSTSNWHKIEHSYLDTIEDSKLALQIPAGSLVLWDSRVFHQNQYGAPNSEERIVQYVCYFPKNHPKYTNSIKTKKQKYFDERRTTSHWPAPVYVNAKQPRTYGDETLKIDYGSLPVPDLTEYMTEISKLI
jgi:hypothetical protein